MWSMSYTQIACHGWTEADWYAQCYGKYANDKYGNANDKYARHGYESHECNDGKPVNEPNNDEPWQYQQTDAQWNDDCQ